MTAGSSIELESAGASDGPGLFLRFDGGGVTLTMSRSSVAFSFLATHAGGQGAGRRAPRNDAGAALAELLGTSSLAAVSAALTILGAGGPAVVGAGLVGG